MTDYEIEEQIALEIKVEKLEELVSILQNKLEELERKLNENQNRIP